MCLIALTELRPGWVRPRWGISTENAAHRFAVEWDEGGATRTGVYVIERHSSDIVPVVGGGRFFPGIQRRARFVIEEIGARFRVGMEASDASVFADVEVTDGWESTLFPDGRGRLAVLPCGLDRLVAAAGRQRSGGGGAVDDAVGRGGGARERGRVVVLRRASARGCADRQCPRDARLPRQLAQTRNDSPLTTGGLVVRGEVRFPTPGADSAVPARALRTRSQCGRTSRAGATRCSARASAIDSPPETVSPQRGLDVPTGNLPRRLRRTTGSSPSPTKVERRRVH